MHKDMLYIDGPCSPREPGSLYEDREGKIPAGPKAEVAYMWSGRKFTAVVCENGVWYPAEIYLNEALYNKVAQTAPSSYASASATQTSEMDVAA